MLLITLRSQVKVKIVLCRRVRSRVGLGKSASSISPIWSVATERSALSDSTLFPFSVTLPKRMPRLVRLPFVSYPKLTLLWAKPDTQSSVRVIINNRCFILDKIFVFVFEYSYRYSNTISDWWSIIKLLLNQAKRLLMGFSESIRLTGFHVMVSSIIVSEETLVWAFSTKCRP